MRSNRHLLKKKTFQTNVICRHGTFNREIKPLLPLERDRANERCNVTNSQVGDTVNFKRISQQTTRRKE